MQTVRGSLQHFSAFGKRIRRTSFILLALGLLLPALSPALVFADSIPTEISTVNPGSINGTGIRGATLNGYLYFAGQDSAHGAELWKTDGTTAGTMLVADINPGTGNSYPFSIINVNGELYFQATDSVHGTQIWKSDGTAAGTTMVSDINTANGGIPLGLLTQLNGEVYFKGNDSTHGRELWKTDGTTAGTMLVADINSGTGNADPDSFLSLNGALYFAAVDSVHGSELWKTDGTTAGTTMLTNINTPSSGTFVSSLRNVGGTLFFLNKTGANSTATIWKSDGTAAGTTQVTNAVSVVYSNIDATSVNSTLFFEGFVTGQGYGLWETDGTTAGTVQLSTVIPVGGTSYLSDGTLTSIGNTVFFAGYDSTHGYQLWKSDGTVTGTGVVTTNLTGNGPGQTTSVNGTLFFPASATSGSGLWRSDGTTQGTVNIPQSNEAGLFSSIGNRLLLLDNHQLWEYDVTSPPTAPGNLTLTTPNPSNQNPSLSWSSVTGATSYNIYRNGTLIDTISSGNTTYTDNLAPEGNNSYYVTAVNSGGESTPSNTVSVLVDRTAPTITYTVAPVADSNGHNTGNVTVTFTCADNTGGSGIASCTSPVTVDNEGIGHTVDGTATDNAGNSTTIHANASLLVTAVNAGGATTGNYSADTDVTGGQTYSSNATVDTSNVTVMPAPQAVYQSVRYGNMTYALPNLTPNANYTLRLHFNELYWNAAGNRVFNVSVNGQPALTNFDIYQTAGGANRAVVEELPVTADASGNVTVQFTTVTDNAMVNGIELYQGALPAEPAAPVVTSSRVNAGGSAVGNFAADTGFTGGTTYSSSAAVDTSGATNPASQAVYQSVRYGNFTYTMPHLTPNTNFLVRLHFNELYWGVNGNGGNGSRVFNVSINGQPALTNFDIYQTAGGANKALVEDFVVPSDSYGNIAIQFTSVTDNAMVSGIEVTQPAVPTPTYFTGNDGTNFSRATSPFTSGVTTQTVDGDGSIGLNVNNASGYADTGFVLYRGTLGNLPNFTTVGTGTAYSANIWFDTNNDGEYFAWNNNVLSGLGGDTYGLAPGSQNGSLQVNGATQLFLISDGQNHSLNDLRNGVMSGIDANTKVAVWIGTNVNSGSAATTIQSVDGL